jgi:hypothetical protein
MDEKGLKEAAVAYFKVQSQTSPGVSEEIHLKY